MEIITEFVQSQLFLVVPVALVVFAGILLFTYSIRPAQQPKFPSGLDDRKTAGKKKKLKEKKSTANGHVSTGAPKSEKSPAKEQKKTPEPAKKEKKIVTEIKEPKKTEVKKSVEPQKKVTKKVAVVKPVDIDDGGWETVPTKKTKKTDQPLVKKDKKAKAPSVEVPAVKEETPEKEEVKPVVVVEEIKAEVEPPVVEEVAEAIEEPAPVVEEKKDKKKKKPKANKPEVGAAPAPKVEIAAPEPVAAPVEPKSAPVEPKSAPVEPKSAPVEPKSAPAATAGVAFDELGDTWTEAKPVKKSKKKARRDN
ncbi:unnamed protein product [Ceutorhynchus assimilis]|uniref:Uncharacterized protein n=1 Tax=Ceutorhynchus assimilis TaxID=467358 RepID=A0A9N9MUE3_9CUCU|nr:unnamed protein product [Ceutorhynchus assimilis]